jgi:alkylmercury lyase
MAALAEGRPAAVEELAAAAGRAPEEVAALLRAVPGVEWDTGGRVAGAGMTLNPTPHRVEAGGHQLYAWCAPDALGMLPAIGLTVRISSPCPATGQTITVTAGPDGVRDLQPPTAVVSAIITGTRMTSAAASAASGTSSPSGRRHPAGRCSLSPMPSTTPGPSCGRNSPTDRI